MSQYILDELRQIKAILMSAHNLGLIRHAGSGEYVAIAGTELNPQQMMNMVDPSLKVETRRCSFDAGAYTITVTDTSRTPESLYPANKNAIEDDNVYVYTWCKLEEFTYSVCSRIAQNLYVGRSR